MNNTRSLRVRVEATGEESRLGRILRDVAQGATRRAPIVQMADRLAGIFVAVVMVLAVVTALQPGRLILIPNPAQRDATGLPMEMVFPERLV